MAKDKRNKKPGYVKHLRSGKKITEAPVKITFNTQYRRIVNLLTALTVPFEPEMMRPYDPKWVQRWREETIAELGSLLDTYTAIPEGLRSPDKESTLPVYDLGILIGTVVNQATVLIAQTPLQLLNAT